MNIRGVLVTWGIARLDRKHLFLTGAGTLAASEDSLVSSGENAALVHESKLARRHGPNHRCLIARWRKKLGGHVGHRIQDVAREQRFDRSPTGRSWLEDHRR